MYFPRPISSAWWTSFPKGSGIFCSNKPVRTSFIQKLPFARTKYRSYLPLMPMAVEQFDFSSYDLILSSSYAVAKGIITGPDQMHICYCHSPIRYAWDMQNQYLAAAGLTKGLRSWLDPLSSCITSAPGTRRAPRAWIRFMANSQFVARRIEKTYRRQAAIVHPPVDLAGFSLQPEKEGYYLTASRMVPYKRIDLIVEAFSGMPERELRVIGDGPDFEKIKAKAGPNVKMLGYQSFEALKSADAEGAGICFRGGRGFRYCAGGGAGLRHAGHRVWKGGVTETVIDGETGVFYDEQTVESLQAGGAGI